MPRPCSVCVHKSRAEIDSALTGGRTYRDVAGHWDLSKSAVERHANEHIAKPLAAMGVSLVEQRERARGTVPGPEYGATLLVESARARSAVAMSLATRAQTLLDRAETFLDSFEDAATGGALDPEVAEAFAKVVSAMSSTLGSAVQALGGGAGKHDEMVGKLTGELTTSTVSVFVDQRGTLRQDARDVLVGACRAAARLGLDPARFRAALAEELSAHVPSAAVLAVEPPPALPAGERARALTATLLEAWPDVDCADDIRPALMVMMGGDE